MAINLNSIKQEKPGTAVKINERFKIVLVVERRPLGAKDGSGSVSLECMADGYAIEPKSIDVEIPAGKESMTITENVWIEGPEADVTVLVQGTAFEVHSFTARIKS